MSTMSPQAAIARGQRLVNWPVMALLCLPAVVAVGFDDKLTSMLGAHRFNQLVLALLVVCFVLAWLWWSVAVPKWRLWAYQNVDDIEELKRLAVEAKLIWPDGSVFAKTEIKSAAHAAQEKALEEQAIQRASHQRVRER